MLVIRIELHSAVTGQITELGKMFIANEGGTKTRGDYRAKLLRKGDPRNWFECKPVREAEVKNHARLSDPVWKLVQKALNALYSGGNHGGDLEARSE